MRILPIRTVLGALGFEIRRKRPARSDLGLYHELYSADSVEHRRFYNVGAGGFRHPAWTNIDHPSAWYGAAQHGGLDLAWDALALEPLPIEDAVAEAVYTSHTIEHITDRAAANLFREAYRVLRPRGVFRLTMPNIDLAYAAYRADDRHYFDWIDYYSNPETYAKICLDRPMREASTAQIFLWHFATAASILHTDGAPERISDEHLATLLATLPFTEALDACTARCPIEVQKKYPGNHTNWWNADKLRRFLGEAGFEEIYLSGFGQSRCPVLRNTAYFDNTRPKNSLYMEVCR